mgnify:CR=1 FL=1
MGVDVKGVLSVTSIFNFINQSILMFIIKDMYSLCDKYSLCDLLILYIYIPINYVNIG